MNDDQYEITPCDGSTLRSTPAFDTSSSTTVIEKTGSHLETAPVPDLQYCGQSNQAIVDKWRRDMGFE